MATTPNKALPLSTVLERDVDLILAEEFQCSANFIRWFWSRVCDEQSAITIRSLDEVRVKQRDQTGGGEATGETDITVDLPVTLDGQALRTKFLIENKIAAPFQPKQPERYVARLEQMIEEGKCDQGWCVLVAPAEYVRAVPGCQVFHARVTYEELKAYFEQPTQPATTDESQRRRRFRRDVFHQALTKRRTDWSVLNPDEQITRFFRQVYGLAQEIAPQLRMSEPGGKKSPTTWIYLASALRKVATFQANIHIKPDGGYADIQINGWARHLVRIREVLGPLLEPGISIEAATKSAAIRVAIPKWSGDRPFEDQRGAIAEGFRSTLRLQAWYERNLPKLEELGRELGSA